MAVRPARRPAATLGAAGVVSASFLAWLAAGVSGTATVQRVDDLSTTLAPLLAAGACLWAAWRATGLIRRGWALLGASAASWGAGQGIWSWYELVAHREIPFPSFADLGFLGAVPLAVAAMVSFSAAAAEERLGSRLSRVLDGCLIATSLLYASWALVLGPVFRAAATGVIEQLIALAYPSGDVVVATIVLIVLSSSRSRLPLGLLGGALLCLTVADSAFAYFTQAGTYQTGVVTDTGWFAGYLLIAAAALGHDPAATRAPAGPPAATAASGTGERAQLWVRVLLPYVPLTLAVAISFDQQLHHREGGPFLYWTFTVLVLLVVGRQLLALLDNQALNRQLAKLVRRLEHQALHDPLTGLANRALFRDRLLQALTRRARHPAPLAVLFLDLDDFKDVNDGLGHAAGDELLAKAAARLRRCVREADTLARLGGDEFAILLEQPADEQAAAAVAARIVAALAEPFQLHGQEVRVTASIGVALSSGVPDGARDVDAVLHQADVAMYKAKACGKGRYQTSGDRPDEPGPPGELTGRARGDLLRPEGAS
jgi:diguanylate cyclase (GGDEF)-like protein